MSYYQNRRKVNQDKQTEYFEASTWVRYLIPNLWVEIRSPEILQSAGITAQLMKEHEQWFYDYCCYGGYVRSDYAECMNDDQKHIIYTIQSIIQKNHQRDRRKGSSDMSYEIYQHQQQQQQQQQNYEYYQQQLYQQQLYQQQLYQQQLYQQQQGYQQQSGYPQQNFQNYDSNYVQNMNNQQATYYQQQGGYRNKNYNNQGYQSGYNQGSQNYGNQGSAEAYSQQADNYGQNSYHQNFSHQNTHHKQYVEKTQVEPPKQEKIQIQEPQTQPEPIPEPVPEPPKPQRKKFSLQQIKKMIDEAQEETIRAEANPQLIAQIDEMQKWERKTQEIEVVADQKGKKRDGDFQKGKNYNPNQNNDFNRGSKYNKPQVVQGVPDISVGKNQSFATIMEKKKLKERAAETNFAKKKQEEQANLDDIEKAKRDINFDLNRIAPENLKDIAKQLGKFARKRRDICEALIHLIIEKAWEQPRYAGSYAKLSYNFTKIPENQFEFQTEKTNSDKKSGNNNFKHLLIEEVQHSFDRQQTKFPEFADDLEKDDFLGKLKKKMIGNVKFIAELIKSKVLSKKTIKYVLQNLINNFLTEYYTFVQKETPESSIYYFQFEVIIEFMENLGEKFEEISDGKDKKQSSFVTVKELIQKLVEGQTDPSAFDTSLINELKADQFFRIFQVINTKILAKKQGRISALLQNLVERRENGWKKHHVQAEGPKKLKDLAKDDDETIEPEQKAKMSLAMLDEKMKKLLLNFVQDDKDWKKILNELTRAGFKKNEIYSSYLRQVAEDKKDHVIKRLEIFGIFLEEGFSSRDFKEAWKKAIEDLAFLASDIPFCGAALSKILINLNEKVGVRFDEFFIKFDEDEQEDEFWFMEEIYQKVFHYSQNKEVLNFVKPKPKLSHLL